MVTYYIVYDFVLCRFPLTRTYMGGANYFKQIINAWKTAFTIPTEKQCCLERATQVGRSHTFAVVAMIKSRILAATIQVGYSYISPGIGHFEYCRKRDKREVKRDSGT